MKKNTVINILTLVLPLAVVAIAISPNSVTVLRGTEIAHNSFATAVNGSMVGWCPPVTLLLTYAMFGMAVINLLTKKPLWMKLIKGTSFVAGCLAACPILIRGEVVVIPNVFAAILLMVLWVVAYAATYDASKEKEEPNKGRRLSGK